ALGGGSAADTTKGIALAVAEDGRVLDFVLERAPDGRVISRQSTRPKLPIVAMVRPRAGSYVWAGDETRKMRADIDAMRGMADGIVVGALDESGRISHPILWDLLMESGMPVNVLHRAFDETPDPLEALDSALVLGFRRLLTSGQAPTALEGADLIRRLIERAAGRIEILPGAGIRSSNVAELVRRTGCTQVHGTFRDQATGRCDEAEVRRVRAVLDSL
ncbi:MAG: hypothetical protein K2W96_12625, partial [Gemmataceae bacterium]|nr:hypothetical protein [Gemmataceae bacterium]